MATSVDVCAMLTRKGGLEVISHKDLPAQLRIMGRCHPDRWNFFLPVIHRLLTFSEDPAIGWTVDISKPYLLRNDRVLFAWRLIFQAPNIETQYASIVDIVAGSAGPTRVELTSQPLPGYKPGDVRGGVNAKGKGSSSAGSLPMALTRGRV